MGRSISNLRKDEIAEQRSKQAWWGVAGLFMTIAFVGISYVLSAPIAADTHRIVPALDPQMWRIVVGAAVFVGLLSVSGILFSLFAPRRNVKFSEKELQKERQMLRAEEIAKKERQKAMRQRIGKARREGK